MGDIGFRGEPWGFPEIRGGYHFGLLGVPRIRSMVFGG